MRISTGRDPTGDPEMDGAPCIEVTTHRSLASMTLSENRRALGLVLPAFYLVQGIPMGFFALGLTGYLAAGGMDGSRIAGMLAAAWAPLILKLFAAPLMDRCRGAAMGRRRPWLLAAQTGMATTTAALWTISSPVADLAALSAVVFLHNSFAALQDVAVDAMAVDQLRTEERSRVTAGMLTGKLIGMSLGAAGAGTLVATVSWDAAVLLLFVPSILAVVGVFRFRERTGDVYFSLGRRMVDGVVSAGGSDRIVAHVIRAIRSPYAAWLAVAALLGALPARMTMTIAPTFLVGDVGWSDTTFAWFSGGPVLIASVVGALLGGRLADRIGSHRVLYAGTVVIGSLLLLLGFGEDIWRSNQLVQASLLGITSAEMMVRITLFSCYMSVCHADVGATQFTVYMALTNVSNVLGSGAVALLGSLAGSSLVFMFGALFSVVILVFFRRMMSAA